MTDATLIYPHQLFESSPALAKGRRVFLAEEPLLLTHNPIHRSKLVLHKLSMDAYQARLQKAGFDVERLSIKDHPKTHDIFQRLKREKISRLHIVDTTDDYLERAIVESGVQRVWYESPLFLLEKKDAETRFIESKRFMASFYKELRKDRNVLVDKHGDPVGGKWSFDENNRKKIPKNAQLPEDIRLENSDDINAAAEWSNNIGAETYGDAVCWLPYTHEGALEYLDNFLRSRFYDFGPYEDAMTHRGTRLWHSALSPLLNIGLLTPQQILHTAIEYAEKNEIPINSLEGFVRQILGWREFIRASYEVDGRKMRCLNFWGHKRKLPETFWTGDTGVYPVDHTIQTTLRFGYSHHIERLMVMGNFMLLSKIHPTEVYRWFMGMYLDTYDWVMVPNIYAMSQFSDGGSFATKPYISGANYIRKMSDFPRGDWEELWTALYWNFIDTHNEVFKNNHRLSMMPRMLEKMDKAKKAEHFELARKHLS